MREAREGLSLALWVLVGVLAVACAVGGIQVAQAHDARAREAAQHARYDAALAAATAEATAFVNVSHETAEDDLARIAAGATGPLKDRYTEDVRRIVRSLRRDRTATAGEVVWAGVVRVDDVERHGPGRHRRHPRATAGPRTSRTTVTSGCGCAWSRSTGPG